MQFVRSVSGVSTAPLSPSASIITHKLIKDIESKWEVKWNVSKQNLQPSCLQSKNKPTSNFYALSMFPYPSGRLHMGHVRVYTINDVIARFHKLNGKKVFQPYGWDAFGLPAENAARINNVNPADWTRRNIQDMKDQLRPLGLAIDWDAEVNTSDPSYYRWTQWIFLKLFNSRLAYQQESYVNWDPIDNTVLANEQVLQGGVSWRSGAKVEQRLMKQWYFKITKYAKELYTDLDQLQSTWPNQVITMQKHWIGAPSLGTSFSFPIFSSITDEEVMKVEIFTTRIETLGGVRFLGFAPLHPLLVTSCLSSASNQSQIKDYINQFAISLRDTSIPLPTKGVKIEGFYCRNPIQPTEKIDLYITPYVIATYATGVIMAVPGHDERDRGFADEHGISYYRVLTEEEKDDDIRVMNSGEFNGLDIPRARSMIIQKLRSLGYQCSSHTSYKLSDWLISRQRYWGAPIPIIHCEDCGPVGVNEEDLPVVLPSYDDYQNDSWLHVPCPKCGKAAKREKDTMDTFVDSSWYYYRYIDPHNSSRIFDIEKVKQMLPVNLYVGGIEHAILHLLYARFISKFLCNHFNLPFSEPFSALLTQGMVQGKTYKLESSGRYITPDQIDLSQGKAVYKSDPSAALKISYEKMSKSKFNGIDPQEVIEQYGADTTRAYILFKAPIEKALEWDTQAITGQSRWFLRVLSLLHHFITTSNLSTLPANQRSTTTNTAVIITEHQLERKLFETIVKVTKAMEEKSFNLAISFLMKFSNDLSSCGQTPICHSTIFYESLRSFSILLSPIAPFVAAEMWEKLIEFGPNISSSSYCGCSSSLNVFDQPWPICPSSFSITIINDADYVDAENENGDDSHHHHSEQSNAMSKMTVQINGKFRGIFDIPNRLIVDHQSDPTDQSLKSIIESLSGTSVAKHLSPLIADHQTNPLKLIFVPQNQLLNFVCKQKKPKNE